MKKQIITLAAVVFTSAFCPLTSYMAFSQNIAINTTGNTANSSALLDVGDGNATAGGDTKGLLVPRVALTSNVDVTTIASPATSLIVYNTNTSMTNGSGTGYYYWDGTKWVTIGTMSTNNCNASSGSVTFYAGTPGTYFWTVPAGVNYICVELSGAGGGGEEGRNIAGSDFGGGGGGGGAYGHGCYSVTPSTVYAVTVGAGGAGGSGGAGNDGATGGTSSVGALISAGGGQGGGIPGSGLGGGGGTSAASTNVTGQNGANNAATIGGKGGYGGNGGNGGAGGNAAVGSPGTALGGGGGGGGGINAGGNGAEGKVIIVW